MLAVSVEVEFSDAQGNQSLDVDSKTQNVQRG